MNIEFIKYLIFSTVFIYIPLWVQIILFLSSFNRDKTPVTTIHNTKISNLILKKTGLNIRSIKIFESPKLFGMMIGIPNKPQLVLSRGLYGNFSNNETEYVVLHEAGHYKLWHGAKEFIAGVVLLGIGNVILRRIDNFPLAIHSSMILGVFFGVLMIRLGRFHEYQADNYSLSHISDPHGLIQATNKFRNYHGPKYTEHSNKIIQFMFYRGNPYDNRIVMANREIEKRHK